MAQRVVPQHAVIVEWWGPCDTLDAVRDEIEQFEDGQYLLCMALREEDPGGRMRCRHLEGWVHRIIDERDRHRLPAKCTRNDDSRPSEFYLGWVASQFEKFTGLSAEWALIRALDPECNDMAAWHLPRSPDRYCVSVQSWFHTPPVNEEEIRKPPPGFPHCVAYNAFDE